MTAEPIPSQAGLLFDALIRVAIYGSNSIAEIEFPLFAMSSAVPMTERYEIAHSESGVSLIFRAGTWESLPFQIRLLRVWYGSEFCDRADLTPEQHLDVAGQGYSIAVPRSSELEKHAGDSPSVEKHDCVGGPASPHALPTHEHDPAED
jgi:hypothetical protein